MLYFLKDKKMRCLKLTNNENSVVNKNQYNRTLEFEYNSCIFFEFINNNTFVCLETQKNLQLC